MEHLLVKYGYLLLFFGIALEGETFLLAGAYLAHRGYFHLWFVVAVAVAANTLADQAYYFAARTRGRAWLEKRFSQNPRFQKVLQITAKHSDWLLLVSRFAFGFRIMIPAACGATGMPASRFTLINFLAGTLWAVPTALLGYYFGQAAEVLLSQLKLYEIWALIGLALTIATILSVRHLRRTTFIRDLEFSDFHALAPMVIGLMGIVNLVAAMFPRHRAGIVAVRHWLPLEVTQGSRPLMIFAGVALLQVTNNLARRKELAWYVAMVCLSMTLLLHIAHAFDLHHSLVAGLLLIYLVSFRHRFHARSDPASLKWGFLMVPILGALVYLYGYVGLTHFVHQYHWLPGSTPLSEAFRSGILIIEPQLDPITTRAAKFLGSLQIAGWLARLYVLVLLLRPVILRSRMEAPREKVSALFLEHSQHSLSAFAIQDDKHHLVLAGQRGLIAYATRGSVAVSCGDPLAPEELFQSCVLEFLKFAQKSGWTPCFYEVAEVRLPIYHALGLRSLKIAEEALIDLRAFSLSGNHRANLRAMVNKVIKTGMEVRRYSRRDEPAPGIDEELEEISEEWLAEKHLGELGFTLGRFSLEAITDIPVFIARTGELIEAFCSWLPYRGGQAVVLDLMRRRKAAPSGTMDLLIAHSLLQLKATGVVEASLANAPLANVGEPKRPLDRGVALLFENMNAFYGYKNLFRFKKKFAPRWEGRYMVYPAGINLPNVAVALASLHSSRGLFRSLVTSLLIRSGIDS
jgi:phosphatidylglycerol lysyltransferase